MCVFTYFYNVNDWKKISTDGTTDAYGADGLTVEIVHLGRKKLVYFDNVNHWMNNFNGVTIHAEWILVVNRHRF